MIKGEVDKSKYEDFKEYYERNPIEFYETYLGAKLTKFQKIKLRVYNLFVNHLEELINEQSEVIQRILIEPYGTTIYNSLKLRLSVFDLRINIIKELLRIK